MSFFLLFLNISVSWSYQTIVDWHNMRCLLDIIIFKVQFYLDCFQSRKFDGVYYFLRCYLAECSFTTGETLSHVFDEVRKKVTLVLKIIMNFVNKLCLKIFHACQEDPSLIAFLL